MVTLFLILHLVVSFILILVVLLQSGKAGDLGSALGGAGSQTAFGSRSAATFITKATAISAVLFMVTSMGLSLLWVRSSGSVVEDLPAPAPIEASQPATTPAAPPAQETATPPPAEPNPAEKPPEQN